MAALPLFLDTVTGRVRASATDDRLVFPRAVAQNDIVAIDLTLVASDAAVTSTFLGSPAGTLAATLKWSAANETTLAQTTTYSLTGQVMTFTLDLTTAAVDTLFEDTDSDSVLCLLEIRITGATAAWRHSWRIPIVVERAAYSATT